MAAAGRDPAVTVGVVGAPSSGIELVLSQNYLPVAPIRVICKNGPQVSIDDIKSIESLSTLAGEILRATAELDSGGDSRRV
jgi:hypothetical protein